MKFSKEKVTDLNLIPFISNCNFDYPLFNSIFWMLFTYEIDIKTFKHAGIKIINSYILYKKDVYIQVCLWIW